MKEQVDLERARHLPRHSLVRAVLGLGPGVQLSAHRPSPEKLEKPVRPVLGPAGICKGMGHPRAKGTALMALPKTDSILMPVIGH